MPPAVAGARDMQVIKVWKKKAKVRVRLPSPYIPSEEQGLRLFEALKGSAQEKIFERDEDDVDFAFDGVGELVSLVMLLFVAVWSGLQEGHRRW